MSEAESAPSAGAVDVTEAAPEEASTEPLEAAEGSEKEGEDKKEESPEELEAKKEEAKKEEVRSKQLAALMRKEAELRRKTADVERREREIQEKVAARTKELEGEAERLQTWKNEAVEYLTRIKSDPIGWLKEEMGIDGERYYELMMNDGKPTKEHQMSDHFRKLQAKTEALEAKLAAKEREEEELRQRYKQELEEKRRQDQENAARAEVEAAREEFWSVISGNSAEFEALNAEVNGERIYPKEVILEGAANLVSSLGDTASEMSYTDLAKQMEASARAWLTKVRGQTAAQQQPPAQAEKSALEKPAAKAEFQKSRRSAGYAGDPIKPRTLTADLSTSKASAKVGRTLEEEKEAIRRELEALPPL
jgi:hypothetical protein